MSAKERSFMTSLWDFFCSLKLTIFTLIFLAVSSILGTVIPQNLSRQEYLAKVGYSEAKYEIYNSLQFFDMYHSWWFLALIVLFSINLISCSIKRLPRVLKFIKEPAVVPDETLYRTLSNMEEQLANGAVSEYKERLAAFVGKNFASPVVTEDDGKVHLFAQKASYARLGVYVTHLSILIIFIGVMIGWGWGYKAFVSLVEGTDSDRVFLYGSNQPVDLGFSVRCDEFSLSFYDTGQPKEYKSFLTILEDGKPVSDKLTRRPIVVNDPLTYKGITFYQASYGPSGNPRVKVRAQVRASGETVETEARLGQMVELPDGGKFRLADFSAQFQKFGPAAKIQVFPPEGRPRTLSIYQKYPAFDSQRGGQYIFTLLDFKQPYFTGLQVAKDPGVWVVWVGCTLMVLGIFAAFFLSHRRIWFTIQPVGDKVGIKFGGTAHRNQPAFELFFDDFKKKLKAELNS